MAKQEKLESVCKHFEYCGIAKITGKDCSFPAYLKCQTYKFYESYGEDWRLIAFGEQGSVPNEMKGEYLK